ncbi:DUF6249 domain-containing protein [uncultured Aquimarina sp.]|uniref:DUF6249 domain-containing protein n=1 Tax=uncultured Aquimarina sp. TaxID=575652 RepID=UPI00262F518C|nr:DUF6249 domain-containing protein [uncultured Aquimarina sp.]
MDGNILVPISFIASVFGIIYIYIASRHRERIAMIKYGVNASQLVNRKRDLAQSLKYGMFLMGIALGILVGYFINLFVQEKDHPIFYFSMTFLFGGISIIINYRMEKKKANI